MTLSEVPDSAPAVTRRSQANPESFAPRPDEQSALRGIARAWTSSVRTAMDLVEYSRPWPQVNSFPHEIFMTLSSSHHNCQAATRWQERDADAADGLIDALRAARVNLPFPTG